MILRTQDSSVSIVTRLRDGRHYNRGSITAGGERSLFPSAQTGNVT